MIERWISLVSSNFLTKTVSLLVAVVIWGIVLGSRVVEVTKDIPLEVVTSVDTIVGNEIPDRVTFKLAGPKAFLRTIMDRREEPIRVNLTHLKPGMVQYRVLSDSIHLPLGVKVQTIVPQNLPIKLELLKRREVPLRLETRGSPPEGYRISRAELSQTTVRVRGAESRVDALTELVTSPVDISGVRTSQDREVGFDFNRFGVQLDGLIPKAHIEIEAVSANFKIKNVDIRVLTPYKFNLDERVATVWIRALPKDLKLLDRSKVYAVVDLRGKSKGEYTEAIKVVLPENVSLVRSQPEKVTISVW